MRVCVCVYIYVQCVAYKPKKKKILGEYIYIIYIIDGCLLISMEGIELCEANYVPLTPISFLERTAFVYGDRVSIVYGNTKFLWKETHHRCIKLASALSQLGVSPGDVVSSFFFFWSLKCKIIISKVRKGTTNFAAEKDGISKS